MRFSPLLLTIGLALGLTAPASAQLAPGEGVRFQSSNGALSGIEFIDLATGSMTPVGNASFVEFNAGALDPVSHELLASGTGATADTIFRVQVFGTNMQPLVPFASTGSGKSINAVDIGPDGNFWFVDGPNLWKADRQTGALTNWGAVFLKNANALAIDRSTRTLFAGTTGAGGAIYRFDLDAGPAPGSLLIDLDAAGFPNSVMDMTIGPAGELFVGTSGAGFGSISDSIFKVDPASGAAATMLGAPGMWVNAIEFNHMTGQLHFLHSVVSHKWKALDLTTGVQTLIDDSHPGTGPFSGVPNGTAMAINDLMNNTEVFPRQASSSAGFLLEATAHGSPGDFAGVAISAIDGAPVLPLLMLAPIGFCSPGGHFPTQTPIAPGLLPPGTTLTVISGTLDPVTLVLTLGPPADIVVGL